MNGKQLFNRTLILGILLLAELSYSQVRLPRLIRDSMVLQRDTRLNIWGWASPGELVKISLDKQHVEVRTGPDGRWLAGLSPVRSGGPYTMHIKASNEIILKNILVGDVWICAGQSNMVHQMELHQERYADEITNANYPEIRHFFIPTTARLEGAAEDLRDGYWKEANPVDVKRFSAVAYFFAKKIYDKYRIPIGLINASVGGTPIEAWTSEEGLKEFPALTTLIQRNKDTAYVNNTNRLAVLARTKSQRKPEDLGMTGSVRWYETSYVPKNWQTINIPGYWEDQGIKNLDGAVWYRREIDVPASMTGIPAKLALGRIVDADYLYINGVLAGNTTYQYPQRRYQLPIGLLKPGKNTIVIRVVNNSGKGGFVPDKPYYISAGGQTIDLKGTWQYKVGEAFPPNSVTAIGISAQSQPAALYNAMIAPLIHYPIKGFLWYQGESNAGRPEEYASLQSALIRDWRNQWKQELAPFFYVQLPGFMEASYLPSESQWAMMRESQLKSLSVAGTGMAVAIDLGEWNDIHPDNKKDVGDRLALLALGNVYGDKSVVQSGPIYNSSVAAGNKIIIHFDHIGSGLMTSDGESLNYFAIAGGDKKFVWAKANIENNSVVVWHDEIPNPLYVRYAWADNPFGANLCNKEGLPASPFRTDK